MRTNSNYSPIILAIFFATSGCGSKSGSRKVTLNPAKVITIAGSGQTGLTDGKSGAATFNGPDGVALQKSTGTLYMTDQNNHMIRKITSEGDVITIAGTGTSGYVDGPAEIAKFNEPDGIVTDALGNAYIADTGNNVIRKIDSEGTVTTIGGTGTAGSTDGLSTTASFNSPTGITINSQGEIFVADLGNHAIRKIDTVGNVTTIAGGTLGDNDGIASDASFNQPHGITIDQTGDLYVTDQGNNKVKKVDIETGTVTTIAGSSDAGFSDGDALLASFDSPHGVTVDSSGVLFVADESNNAIRAIDTVSNTVVTIAGNGSKGDMESTDPEAAVLNTPRGIVLDAEGSVIVCDWKNQKIKKVKKAKAAANQKVNDTQNSTMKQASDREKGRSKSN